MTAEERACEREVLARAVDALGDLITDLPAASVWHWTFLGIRRHVADDAGLPSVRVADSVGRAMTDFPAAPAAGPSPRNRSRPVAIAAARR